MPPKFGVIAKAFTAKPSTKDPDTILDLYVLAYNQDNTLVVPSSTIKSNLQTYINQYRMLGDTVNIKDAFIVNIGCDFEIITLPNFINNDVFSSSKCLNAMRTHTNSKYSKFPLSLIKNWFSVQSTLHTLNIA